MKPVSDEIDSNIQAIMLDLGNKLTPELSQEVASVYNLNAKFAFYNVCFGKAQEILGKVDPKLASVFTSIQETNVFVVSRFTEKLLTLHPTISDLIQRLEEVEKEKENALEKTTEKGGTDITRRLKEEMEVIKIKLDSTQASLEKKDRELEKLRKEKGSQLSQSHQKA